MMSVVLQNGARRPPRTGKYCMRLVSLGLAKWLGSEYAWVSGETKNLKTVPVALGDYVMVEAWVRIPADIKKTRRGAIINLVGIRNDGKIANGWKFGSREARYYQATNGWHRIQVLAQVDRKDVVKVQARIGVGGIGECFFDDVSIRLMKKQPD